MTQKPYLNAFCGRIILPGEQPGHHGLVEPSFYQYPLFLNVDRNYQPGVDQVVDLFKYPWPFEDNAFDSALFAHALEHVPHEINVYEPDPNAFTDPVEYMREFMRAQALKQELQRCYQDGWYLLMHEIWRVCTPGAIVHVLSPYGWSQGAAVDPTHTRLLFEHTFTHSMAPDPNSPFEYATGGLHFEMEGGPVFRLNELFAHVADDQQELGRALATRLNVCYEIMVKLRVVK